MSTQTFTTLCYVEQDGKYLMLHRTKKENDMNKDKYIGIGGHIEHGETPTECIVREAMEETGLRLINPRLRGLITFVIDDIDEYTFLYTCDEFEGELRSCNEGDLEWIDKNRLNELPLWEGDKVFFDLLDSQHTFFSLKLVYVHGKLVEVKKE
ncbi:MAG: 8-oxo-dGTP diphosphatase [bacterium]|nr:8-oxo-dGTP diphosphatase [bacterium]